MFDIGFLEMMTIGIVALLVIGPERLPEVAAKVGRYVGKAQRFVRGVRSDISRELESGDLKKLIGDQKDQIDELRKMVTTATKDIETSTSGAFKDAEKSIGDLSVDSFKSDGTEPKSETRVDTSLSNTSASTSANNSASSGEMSSEPEQLNQPASTTTPDTGDDAQQQNNKAS